jgi:hypothetical protein
MSLCAGDWMRIRVGELHQRKDDPRHTARIEAIHNSATVKLYWLESEPRLIEFVTLHAMQTEFQRVRR